MRIFLDLYFSCQGFRIHCLAYFSYYHIIHVRIYTYIHTYTPTHTYTAVLFLEFWKRRQYKLQYDWNMLGYEAAEVGYAFVFSVVRVLYIQMGK